MLKIDKDENRKFYLHNLSNRNEEHLTESSHENRLTWLNNKFQKREENYLPIPTDNMLKHW